MFRSTDADLAACKQEADSKLRTKSQEIMDAWTRSQDENALISSLNAQNVDQVLDWLDLFQQAKESETNSVENVRPELIDRLGHLLIDRLGPLNELLQEPLNVIRTRRSKWFAQQ